MSSIACWVVAWAVVGADAPEPPAARATYSIRMVHPGGDLPVVGRLMSNVGIAQKAVEPEQITYEVRVVTVPAAEWREAYYRHCKRIGREGRSTVWTLDEKTAKEMSDRSTAAKPASAVMAPRITSFAGAPATVTMWNRRTFCVDVDRVADGPVDHAGALKLEPSAEEVNEGFSLTVKGQKTADGIRAHVKAESTWVGHVARASTRERIENRQFGKTSIECPLELPQVVEAKIDGDYEIPAGRQMLASLGTAMTVDEAGKPVVMERLLLVAARPIAHEPAGKKPVDAAVRPAAAVVPAPAADLDAQTYLNFVRALHGAVNRKRMPPLPSRTPLEPIGPDGKVVELPPLPEDFVAEAEAVDGSSAPQPSPQTRVARPAAGSADPKVARSSVHLDGRELASGRPQVVKIPLGAGLAIELQARVVPGEKPE